MKLAILNRIGREEFPKALSTVDHHCLDFESLDQNPAFETKVVCLSFRPRKMSGCYDEIMGTIQENQGAKAVFSTPPVGSIGDENYGAGFDLQLLRLVAPDLLLHPFDTSPSISSKLS